jgi:group I intron endonuclease
MIVYKTTNLINGKIYVGQDLHNDQKYLGSGIALQHAIQKYGRENFLKETLEVCNSKEELDSREVYWIDKLNSIEIGYNIAHGGTGGDTLSNHPRKDEILEIRKNSIRSTYSNMSIEEKRKKFSHDSAELSKRQLDRMKDPVNRKLSGRSGPEHWAYGKPQSNETIKKRKLSMPYKTASKGPFAPKKVVVVMSDGTEIVFDSIKAAAKHLEWTVDSVNYLVLHNKNGNTKFKDGYTVKYL